MDTRGGKIVDGEMTERVTGLARVIAKMGGSLATKCEIFASGDRVTMDDALWVVALPAVFFGDFFRSLS